MSDKVTIGHDAEVFLYHADSGGVISSVGKIGGTKQAPKPVPGSKTGLAVQEDGVTVEFNNTPVEVQDSLRATTAAWNDMFSASYKELQAYLRSINPHYEIAYGTNSHKFRADELKNPQAATFGCDPDFQAHLNMGAPREALEAKNMGGYRFCGGHVHIGYDKSKIPSFAMVQLLEGYIYIAYRSGDNQKYRAQYYGLPGLFREKPYGVEYRTPSNFWVFDSPGFPAALGMWAKTLLANPDEALKLWQTTDWERVQRNINGRQEQDYVSANYDLAINLINTTFPEKKIVAPPEQLVIRQDRVVRVEQRGL